MSPLERLFEVDGLPSAGLPEELERLYGGPLGLDEPRLFANFVATLDGVVAIPSIPESNSLIAAGSRADHLVMGLLRALADVVLIGSGVLRASPQGTWLPEKVYPPAADAFAELRRRRDRPGRPEVAVLSGRGSIDPAHPLLASGAVVLTSERGAGHLAGRLPEASMVVTLGDDVDLPPAAVVSALHDRGHRLILAEAGPHTFGSLVEGGVVDELFLTLSPLLAGDAGPDSRLHLVEAVDLLPPVGLRLLSLRRREEHLFLRYELNRAGA
ncbi:MAG: dihydrofolate reductase family protein [Gaiellaceae bacterium]